MICFITIIDSYMCFVKKYNAEQMSSCYVYENPKTDNDTTAECVNMILSADTKADEFCEKSRMVSFAISDHLLQAGDMKFYIEDEIYEYEKVFDLNHSMEYETLESRNSFVFFTYYKDELNVFPKILFDDTLDFVIGKWPSEPGEIMLDTYLLEVYCPQKEPSDLIGKTITICENDSVILEDYIVTGVVYADTLAVRENLLNGDSSYYNHIYVNFRDSDLEKFRVYSASIRNYFNNYDEYKDYCSLSKLLFDDTDASEPGTLIPTSVGEMYCLLYLFMTRIGIILLICGFVITAVILSSLISMWYFYRKRNEKFRTMIYDIGMNHRDQSRIFGLETLMICSGGLVIGIYMSAMLLLIFAGSLKSVLDFQIHVPYLLLILSIATVIIVIELLFSRTKN